MLDSIDGLFDVVAFVFLIVIVAIVIVGIVWLGSLPGAIAHKRNHPQAEAITVLGWLGVLFIVLWPIAFTWAFIRSGSTSTGAPGERE